MTLQALILRLLRRIAPAYRQQLRLDGRPSADLWLAPMVEALTPAVGQLWRQGARRGLRGIAAQLRRGPRRRKHLRLTHPVPIPAWSMDWNLFNVRIEQAIQEATFAFCRSTLATIDGDVDAAMADLRAQMLGGLREGEASKELTARVQGIIEDPVRARLVAHTEERRAVNGGQLLADRESGIVDRKQWLASSDACEVCLAIAAKGAIPLDEPFYVWPKGGPYATIMHAPAHPGCFCTHTSVVNYDLVEHGQRERLTRLEEAV